MARPHSSFEPFWSNPVVVRDIRVRFRGGRAFWQQGLYLFIVGTIAVSGYASATSLNSRGSVDPVDAQRGLNEFSAVTLMGLAVMVTLIAPSLTSVSVITERIRLTLDLLIASPLPPLKMLIGKIVSSVAFLALLLVLSLPISMLCVILGGASLGDVLSTYALLLIDCAVLSAIGLFFSCTAKQQSQAIVGTYASILLLITILTNTVTMFAQGSRGDSTSGAHHGGGTFNALSAQPPICAVGDLSPFSFLGSSTQSIAFFGHDVPAWIATGVIAALVVRLLLTASAVRLGTYGSNLVGSLRRQILFLTLLVGFLLIVSLGQYFGIDYLESHGLIITLGSIVALAGLYMATLFVPVIDEDAPDAPSLYRRYDIRAAFGGEHAGSLPFAVASIANQASVLSDAQESLWLSKLWLVYPWSRLDSSTANYESAFLYDSALAYFLGIVVYPFWFALTPGAGSRGGVGAAIDARSAA